MAEKPSPLAKTVVGGLIIGAGALTLYNLFFRAKLVQVALTSQPIKIEVLIDDKTPAETPTTIKLAAPAKHKFSAPLKGSDLLRIYEFYRWTLNGKPVSYDLTTEIPITKPSTVKAEYILAEAHPYPIMPL